MKELRNVGHDRLLVRTLHVNVLRVQKPGDSQFSVRNREGSFESNEVGLVSHGFEIDDAWSDAVDDSKEVISVSPAWSKVVHLNPKLLAHLSLDPLQQSLFGSNLPALLSFPADASLAHRTVVI